LKHTSWRICTTIFKLI